MTPDEAYRDAIRRFNEADERMEAARQERQQARRDMLAVLPDVLCLPKGRRPYRRKPTTRSRWMYE